jgi:hypothetical protein
MKKILFLSFAALLIAGNCHAQVKTPPHAASTRTWTIGKQVWSDAIQMPNCKNPSCISFTYGLSTWYYYTWEFVKANAKTMCPAPWRVPTRVDLVILINKGTGSRWPVGWRTPGYWRLNAHTNPQDHEHTMTLVTDQTDENDNILVARLSPNVSIGSRFGTGSEISAYGVRCVR